MTSETRTIHAADTDLFGVHIQGNQVTDFHVLEAPEATPPPRNLDDVRSPAFSCPS